MSIVIATARRNLSCMFVGALFVIVPWLGCAATNSNYATAETQQRQTTAERSPDRASDAVREVERRYVVGPLAGRELGYQVDWQSSDAGQDIKLLHVAGNSVYALDRRNFLTRIERNSGRRIWRIPVAEPVQEIIAVNAIDDRVYLTSGGRLIVLDRDTGSQVALQRLEKIANTPPVRHGQFLIYGGRNGQLIWHSYPVAFQWRAYQVSQSINIQPLIVTDNPEYVVTVGNDGRVTVHNTATASLVWDKRLLANVAARPAAGNGAVYVAGLDQHIWAYNLYNGRNIWRYLTASELRDSPVLIGERLFQQVPTEGLICFNALPMNAPGGEKLWKADVRGNVISQRGNRLFVWNSSDRVISILDARRGGIIAQHELRQAKRIISNDLEGSELFAIGDDGRIVRLVARN